MFDVLIRHGDVVDGSGAPRRRADVGIRAGRVEAIAECLDAEAGRTIDARGRVVAPGFIDVHTHYDAQVFWDQALTPSPQHGVTTVVAGNCGFSIAPLSGREADADYVLHMLARVEGMPADSLAAGVPWDWRSTDDYLAAVDGSLGVNVGFMVGHSAIRRAVMGEDAARRESDDDELKAMCRLLHESLEAGGVGFSSSWARSHSTADGRMVPSRCASVEELLALATVTGEHEGTSLEFIAQLGPRFDSWAIDLMSGMSTAAQRPLNWNALTVNAANSDEVEDKLALSDIARSRGGKVVALVPSSFPPPRLSLNSGFILDVMPGWDRVMALPLVMKLALFRDQAVRRELDRLAHDPSNPLKPSRYDWATMKIWDVVAEANEGHRGRLVGEIAAERGVDPLDVLADIAVADELRTSFGPPPEHESDDDWRARATVLRDSRSLVGASDAGAHLDMIGTFNYATVLLAEAVRKRQVLSLEEAIQMLTDAPAQLYGLIERGRIQEGFHADVVVFDPSAIGSEELAMRFDLPAGAGRLYADALGIDHVLVNGQPIIQDGRLTKERSGKLLRSSRDTRTPNLS